MNQGELLNQGRLYRLDDTAVPPLWPDQELTDYFNSGVRQICLRQRALIESERCDMCEYQVQPGQLTIDLHPDVLAVRFARAINFDGSPSDTHRRVLGITTQQLMRDFPNWIDDTDRTDHLEYWIPDYQEGKLALFPYAAQGYTLKISVWRVPLESEQLKVTKPKGVPVINTAWHEYLLDWMEHKAYSKRDADTFNQKKADAALATFTDRVGRLPTATEVRLWGIHQNVRSRTEFC